MTYESCRFFVPSSLPASQTASKRVARARKTALKSTPLTYADIFEKLNYFVSTKQLNEHTAANRATALRAFMRANHVTEADVVGSEMRTGFPECAERLINTLRDGGTAQRNITNTRSALTPVRQMVQEDDTARALDSEKPTPFMQQLKTLLSGHSVSRVARMSKVPYDMVLGWLRGKVPRASSSRYVYRVENYFGMTRGELWKLSGVAHPSRLQPQIGIARPIEYREQLGALTRHQYWFVPDAASPLRQQWHDFMVYKTALAPDLERSSKGRWRFSPLPMGRKSSRTWYQYLGDQEVSSAAAVWAKLAGYYGWLMLPAEKGGAAIPGDQLHTLAWLVLPEFLVPYLEWRKARSGGKHSTFAPEFVGWVMSLVREVEGYFPQSPWLQGTLPEKYQQGTWIEQCAKQMKYCRRLTQSLRGQVHVRRDPFEPLLEILELPEPMEALVDMIARMRANRPISSPKREAIWSRDLVLIKLLASNPLRERNLAHLTWRPDNTGNLYQRSDGTWHIRWKSTAFKNSVGAAGDMDYDAEIHSSVYADLERYLHQHRPKILHSPSDLVILSMAKTKASEELPHVPWNDLSKRVTELTRRYLWKTGGIGTHSFRHLIGSSILKAAPGEIQTVARVLNDRPATVEKHYARFSSSDGNKRMGEVLGKSFRRM